MIVRIPDIRLYDFEFNLLHVENHFISTNWSIQYNDIGTFEAHFDLESDSLPIIMKHDYLVVVQGDYAAIVVGRTLRDDLTVFGRTCNWLLTKRAIDAFKAESGTVSELANTIFRTAFSDEVTAGKVTEGLPIEDTSSVTPGSPIERSDKCLVFDVIQECLEQVHLGHRLIFDVLQGKWVFQVEKGDENSLLVISAANRNAYDVSMDGDSLDYATEGWYKRKMEYIGDYDNSTWTKDGEPITRPDTSGSATQATNYGKYWKITADVTGALYGISGLKKGHYIICRETNGELKKSDNADAFWVLIQKQPHDAATCDCAICSSGAKNCEKCKCGIYRWENLLSGDTESEAQANLTKARRTNKVQATTAEVYFGRDRDYSLGDIVTVQHQAGQYKHSAKKRIVGVNLWYESGNVGEEPVFQDIEEEIE